MRLIISHNHLSGLKIDVEKQCSDSCKLHYFIYLYLTNKLTNTRRSDVVHVEIICHLDFSHVDRVRLLSLQLLSLCCQLLRIGLRSLEGLALRLLLRLDKLALLALSVGLLNFGLFLGFFLVIFFIFFSILSRSKGS